MYAVDTGAHHSPVHPSPLFTLHPLLFTPTRVKSKEKRVKSGKKCIGKYDHVCRGCGSTPFTDTPFTALHPSPFTLHSHTSKEKRVKSGKECIGKYDHVCRGYGSTPFTDTPFTALHPSPFTLHSHTSKEKRVKSGKECIGKYDHVCRGYGSTPFTGTPFTLYFSPLTLSWRYGIGMFVSRVHLHHRSDAEVGCYVRKNTYGEAQQMLFTLAYLLRRQLNAIACACSNMV
jgi:hypothetical protein